MPSVKKRKVKTNEIDCYIGNRLKTRRTMLGLTQEKLAEAFGVTAQQVQKYESGANRMGGSRLLQASQILKTPVQYFFEGLEELETTEESETKDLSSLNLEVLSLVSSEIAEFLCALTKIKNQKIREQLLIFIKALSNEQKTEEN